MCIFGMGNAGIDDAHPPHASPVSRKELTVEIRYDNRAMRFLRCCGG